MKGVEEVEEFLEKVKKIELPPKPESKPFEFTYPRKAREELKKIIKNAIETGKARVEGRKGIYYHEGDGYQEGWRQSASVILVCEETPYGTMTFSLEPLEKIILKPEDMTDEDIEELVEKLDIDFHLEYGFAPKHPFRRKYMELKKKEWEEYKKAKEQRKAEIKQWEEENREKLEKIMELYNNLSEEAKNKLRYLIDPYNGLFGFDPTPEQIIQLAKNPPF